MRTLLATLVLLVLAAAPAAAQLPPSKDAPKVGDKAPEFTLPDTSEKPVKLSELLAGPQGGPRPAGVLLIFYRGYW